MLQVENVAKRYRRGSEEVVALQPTSFEVNAGEFVSVVGPSGSGKTTLLSILGGMLAPNEGQVRLGGGSLYQCSPSERARIRQKQIGFVFQTFNLVTYLTALDNVKLPLLLSKAPPERQHQQASRLLGRVGLAARLHHKPCELSIGQQQRVALARTLANDPAVILADEPTGNLDPDSREQVLQFFEELRDEGRTVIMVTHDPAAASRAGRTIRLADGDLVNDTRLSPRQAA